MDCRSSIGGTNIVDADPDFEPLAEPADWSLRLLVNVLMVLMEPVGDPASVPAYVTERSSASLSKS
jgi:hypothetical protein